MRQRAALRPLAAPEKPAGPPTFTIATTTEQLIADLRLSFPEFEAQLNREYPDAPLDAFATQDPRALLFVFLELTDNEHKRRSRFIASLLRAGPPAAVSSRDAEDLAALERFALQEEGLTSETETPTGTEPRAAQADRVAESRPVPPQPARAEPAPRDPSPFLE